MIRATFVVLVVLCAVAVPAVAQVDSVVIKVRKVADPAATYGSNFDELSSVRVWDGSWQTAPYFGQDAVYWHFVHVYNPSDGSGIGNVLWILMSDDAAEWEGVLLRQNPFSTSTAGPNDPQIAEVFVFPNFTLNQANGQPSIDSGDLQGEPGTPDDITCDPSSPLYKCWLCETDGVSDCCNPLSPGFRAYLCVDCTTGTPWVCDPASPYYNPGACWRDPLACDLALCCTACDAVTWCTSGPNVVKPGEPPPYGAPHYVCPDGTPAPPWLGGGAAPCEFVLGNPVWTSPPCCTVVPDDPDDPGGGGGGGSPWQPPPGGQPGDGAWDQPEPPDTSPATPPGTGEGEWQEPGPGPDPEATDCCNKALIWLSKIHGGMVESVQQLYQLRMEFWDYRWEFNAYAQGMSTTMLYVVNLLAEIRDAVDTANEGPDFGDPEVYAGEPGDDPLDGLSAGWEVSLPILPDPTPSAPIWIIDLSMIPGLSGAPPIAVDWSFWADIRPFVQALISALAIIQGCAVIWRALGG